MNENTLKNVLIGVGSIAVLIYMLSLTNPFGTSPKYQTKTISGIDVPTLLDGFKGRGYACGGPEKDSTVSVWTCNKEFGWGTVRTTVRARAEDQVLEYATRADVGNRNPEMAVSELQFAGSFWYKGAAPDYATSWIQDHATDTSAVMGSGNIWFIIKGRDGVRTLEVDADRYRK